MACITHQATSTVHGDQCGLHKGFRFAPGLDSMSVELFAGDWQREGGRGLEGVGQIEGVGRVAGSEHAAIEIEALSVLALSDQIP